MKPENQLRLSFYKEVAAIDRAHDVFLVQHVETEQFFVKKTLSTYNYSIYQTLMEKQFRNTPHIYQCFEDDGKLFVIEEYINGRSLKAILNKGVTFSVTETINLICKLCEVLEPLHCQDPPLIHRDIKPSNIMISSDGILKLIDFNAAKQFDKDKNQDTMLIGTVDFAAPEQYGFSQSDVRTDIYSIGVLLNLLLTGQLPKENLHQGPLTGIIQTCTEMSPKQRFFSVGQLKQALMAATPCEEIDLDQVMPKRQYLPPGFRSGKPWHIVIGVLGYLFVIAVSVSLQLETPGPTAQLYMNRIFCGAMFLAVIAFLFNYLGVQRFFPFMQRWKSAKKGYIVGALLIMLIFMSILVILEMIIWPT